MAAVIKYGDNILKNFTTACSVILGTLVSVYFFDFVLSLQFLWGSAIVIASTYAYATAPTAPQPSAAVAPMSKATDAEYNALGNEGSDTSDAPNSDPP